MSGGFGVVQRTVLAVLLELTDGPFTGWTTVSDLARIVWNTSDPTRAQVESVRRAAKALADAGRVELDYMPEMSYVKATEYDAGPGIGIVHRARHVGDRQQLFVHLTLSVEERALVEGWLERLVTLDRQIG